MRGNLSLKNGVVISVLISFCGYLFSSEQVSNHVFKDDDGIACEVVAPAEAGPVAHFAARELQRFLSRSLGGEVPLVEVPTGQKTSIILGNTKQLRDAGVDVAKLKRDGFVIKSSGNNILIAGRDDMKENPKKCLKYGGWGLLFERGTLFGVYDFLERFAGVRFYFPGEMGTIVPKHETLKVPAMDILSNPDFTARRVSANSGVDLEGRDEKNPASRPFKNLNCYRLRFETKYTPCCHSLERLGYQKRFAKEHPEYLALDKSGKRITDPNSTYAENLCLTSKGFRDELYKDAEAFLTGKSAKSRNIEIKYGQVWDPSAFQPGYFNIMCKDWFLPCQCEECQKYYQGKKYSNYFDSPGSGQLYWELVADIAGRLQKNGIDGRVTAMAYAHTKKLPSVSLPSNVMVMVSVTGPWSMGAHKVKDFDDSVIKGWTKKIGGKVWLWNAMYKYSKLQIPDVPQITPKAVGEYYKEEKDNIFGAFVESETDKFIYNYLNYYVFAKVAWDNSTDVDALLKEHYRLMFGKAAEQMEKVYNIFEEKWFKVIGRPIETPLGPTATGISEYELWEKVYSKEAVTQLDSLFGAAEKAAANDPECCKRVKFMRAQLLDPLKARRETYFRNKEEINELSFYLKPLDAGEKINIDGKIDEGAWKNADKISLIPFAENKLKKDSLTKTAVRGLRDDKNLYFVFECEEPRMKDLAFEKRKHDDPCIWHDSSVEIFLNPTGDRENYFQLLVNPAGSLSDLRGRKKGAGGDLDWNWDSGAQVAVSRRANSWIAELAIPIKSLEGFSGKDFQANFNRNRKLKEAGNIATLFTWTPFLKHGFHEIENFGKITFQAGKGPVVRNGGFSDKIQGRYFGGWYAPQEKDLKKGESWKALADDFTMSGACVKLSSERKDSRLCITQYLPEMKPDTKYLLSYAVKIKNLKLGASPSGVCVNVGDTMNMWFPKNWYNTDMPWTRQGFQFTSRPDTNKDRKKPAYIRLWIMHASGDAFFGDVKIREIRQEGKKDSE